MPDTAAMTENTQASTYQIYKFLFRLYAVLKQTAAIANEYFNPFSACILSFSSYSRRRHCENTKGRQHIIKLRMNMFPSVPSVLSAMWEFS